ncbi:MAG: DNA-binding response OmpR family regulator [Parvicellaceae bacterium]|jgi:DNA-binding response OmpR family regulator
MKLLLIEDDKDLLRSMLFYFDSLGYRVERAKTIKDGLELIDSHQYDCLVLDVNLPDGSGLEILRKLKRKKSNTGVLILSANSELDDKLDGLEIGADDYLTKPFHLSELNARIRSIVRRNNADGNNTVVFGDLKLDYSANEAFIKGNQVALTKKEYDLLAYLVINKNKVVTKQSIADYIWGDYVDQSESADIIYSHLKNLRKKLLKAGGIDPIKTVHGIGYKFSVEEIP